MDRNREARRVTMAASNGLSRRRHRSNSLRDSPEDDGPLELQETVRLRDRGPGKKDRDRDRERDHRERDREKDRDRDRMSSRSKRRRGDRMMHGSNREDGGDDSSEESVNDEEDEDDDDGSGVGGGPGGSSMRMLPPNPTSFSSSSMSNHHHRKSFPPPAKVFRTGPTLTAATPPTATTPSPNATPWKAPDEMIGVSVPRKARSASTKRSHECWASSGGGVVGGEQIHRQASTSPARSSGPGVAPMFASASPSPAPVSPPSSSNASVKKKMKPNGPKQRPPKSSTKSVPSAQDEIEIEIAQVLFGLGRQPQGTAKQEIMGNDSIKFDSRDVNNNINKSSFDAKSRVSSPISNSPSTITLAPSSIPPTTNSSSSATPMSAIAPRRKRPRPVKYEEENPSAYPVRNSPMSLTSKAETDQPAKIDVSSPNLDKSSIENGVISYDLSANQVAQVSAEPKPEAVKPENNNLSESKSVAEESAGRDLTVNREEPRSPKKEPSSGLRLDGDRGSLAGTKGNSAISESENHREEKFQIDLMAPPPSRSSPERDSEIDFVAIDPKKPKLQDVEMEMKPVVKDDEKKAVKFGKDDMNAEHVEKKTKVIAEEPQFQKPSVNRERNVDLHFDLEKSDKDNANATGTGNKLQHHGQKLQQQQPNAEKTVQTSSLPLPMSLASWPGALPHMGYMAPLQGVVSMDGNTVSSTPIQPPHLLFNQPRPKRCATHCYIARIIQCHQQIARMNPFWPAATGSALAYGPKPCNVNVLPSPESHAGRGVNSVQDKGQGIAIFPGPTGKEKSSQPSNIVDNTQRKQILLQQALPPGAPGNILHGPAFIFPLSQQQAAAVRPGTVKSPPVAVCGGSSSSASVSATATAVAGATAMSFNYPNLPGNETQYLAILQNGPYPIPIPAHVGATPPYRGAHTQALPFFNGSFYSSQMLHPSQLQQQQSAASQSQQSQQGHQNPSISSGSSSSQKHLQNQQQRPHGSGNLQGFPAPKHQQSHSLQLQQRQQTQSQNVPHQARQLESELGGEDSPSTADSRVSRSNMSIYGQNFAIPMNQPNFALMTPASMGGAGGNPGEKKQHSHAQGSKHGVEALTSQPFAMSFPSINGTSTPGFDISSIAQNHAFIQNLPEATRHNFHFMAAAVTAQAAQQKKNYRISDEGKTGGDGSNLEEERKAMAGGKAPPNAAQLIAFSRPDPTDASASTMPGNTVIDSSARTLNLSSTPARASSSIMSAAISNANTPPVQQQLQRNHQQQLQQHHQQQQQLHQQPLQQHQQQQQQLQQQQQQQLQQQQQQQLQQLQQQHQQQLQQHQHQQMQQQQQQQQQHQQQQQQQQQQVIQLHKQHQFAAAAAAASARSKAPATSNGSVYSDHLSSSPSMATKFPNTLPAFPQTLVQSSSSPVQSPQWKNSMRTTTSQIPPPSLASASPSLKNLPQQQGRTQQGHAQISFSANPKPTAVQQGAPPSNNQSSSPPMVVGSPTTSSVSKGAGGSPRTSSSAGNKGGQSSSLSSQQAKNSPSVPAQKSSPAGGRNVPSILGHPHNAPSSSSSGTKPQLTQQQQQQPPKHALQQAQMLYTSAYMQVQAQAQHAAERTTNSGSAASGFYLQRHRGEHQQQPPGSSANSSSGMLSLCTPVTLANTSTTDPAKAVAAAAAVSNMKGGGLASQGLVHAQFAAATGKQQHQLLPAGFSYVHAVPSTVQVKPSEQKQPAGE